jgi:hypothetical protein
MSDDIYVSGYRVGDQPTLIAEFYVNNALTIPDNIHVGIKDPDNIETTGSATQAATGIYTVELPLTKPHWWQVQIVASGTVFKPLFYQIHVTPSVFD